MDGCPRQYSRLWRFEVQKSRHHRGTEIFSQVIKGSDYSFLIAFSDGIGGVISDQEVVDLCRDAKHPSQASQNVLKFAEELGAEDNCTVMVIPLKGWGTTRGQDSTRERREVRRSKIDLYRDNRQ